MNGVAGRSAGVLEDYANVAAGFLTLAGVTGRESWVGLAGQLLETALDRFRDPDGGFYDTADDGERLIYRPADPGDGPTPSGTFAIAGALLSYAALTGSARHREAAAAALGTLADVASRYPQAGGWGLAVAEAFLAGPDEIAIVGPRDDAATIALHQAAALGATPGAVLALGDGAGDGAGDGRAMAPMTKPAAGPVTAFRCWQDAASFEGRPAAYVCRNFACRLPVTSPDDLLAALGR